MAYFPDLSPYAYGRRSHPNTVHVGWLDAVHPFRKGQVATHLVDKMKSLAASPTELYRGFHVCELCLEPPGLERVVSSTGVLDARCSWCEWAAKRQGNGEIRVSSGEITFAAPVLIVHYVEEHGYLPPPQSLQAIAEAIDYRVSGR